MRPIILFTFLMLVAFPVNSIAQINDRPTASQDLKAKVESGDYDAVTEAGSSGDSTLIPYLKQLALNLEQRKNFNSAAFRAHIALAKLGDETALREIMNEVDAEDPFIQDAAMSKLSAIGNDAAFRKFYELLDDAAPRKNPQCRPDQICHALYLSRNSMAMFFLSRMVEVPPTKKSTFGRKQDIPLWKQWFEKNKPWIK